MHKIFLVKIILVTSKSLVNSTAEMLELHEVAGMYRLATVATAIVNVYLLMLVAAEKVGQSNQQSTREFPVTLSIKMVVFADVTLTYHLENNLKLNDKQIDDLFHAYIDQVEANFIGLRNDKIDRIQFELTNVFYPNVSQPLGQFETIGLKSTGDIDILLDNFCQYQASLRQHKHLGSQSWHLSLLLTANDLFSRDDEQEGQRRRQGDREGCNEVDEPKDYAQTETENSLSIYSSTMGISLLNGINWPDLACLIVEFGVNFNETLTLGHGRSKSWSANNTEAATMTESEAGAANISSDKNYNNPTRGFASTWVAAHEIGHSLGLHHDGAPFNTNCNATKWMMSASSFVETINLAWSNCSIEALDLLDLNLIDELTLAHEEAIIGQSKASKDLSTINRLPGRIFTAEIQCKVFATNLALSIEHLNGSICNETLWCELHAMATAQEHRLVAIGPALEGTQCNRDGTMICLGQQCTNMTAEI